MPLPTENLLRLPYINYGTGQILLLLPNWAELPKIDILAQCLEKAT